MKITILLRRDADDFKGEIIAAHNRTKEIIRNFPEAEVDLLVFREYFNSFFCKLRGTSKIKKEKSFEYDGLSYKALWFNFSPIDNVFIKLNIRPFFIFQKLNRFVKLLNGSDIVIAHSTFAGYVALRAKKRFGIPYMITWHGTDIHTTPNTTTFWRNLTVELLNHADANCFVSKYLLTKSNLLTKTSNKYVLYNGVDQTRFRRFSEEEKKMSRDNLVIDSTIKNIAFIGNLYHVKNVLVLPDVFSVVSRKFEGKIKFHFIGDGYLRNELNQKCKEANIDYKMWGNQSGDKIPMFINCMDLIVLPSKNEGLPLISVESLACGVPMVGSRVGGIAEAIGEHNVVELGDTFVQDFASLIITKLKEKKPVSVGKEFSWIETGLKEKQIIESIVNH